MKKLYGNTTGLKANQIKRLGNLYRRRIPPDFLVSQEVARDICRISREIRRQIGIMINRRSKVVFVIVGDSKKIIIPNSSAYRAAPGRLRGLRCIHTHLNHEALTDDDLTDLALLRLDMMAVITSNGEGIPQKIHAAHIMPEQADQKPYQILPPLNPGNLDIGCEALIVALEDELSRASMGHQAVSGSERALLVSVTSSSGSESKESMAELRELALSGGIEVVDAVVQHRPKADSRLLIGRGKLQDLAILALQKAATLIIFDQELSASQIRSITDQIDLKVIDRTQLILDIFAQRARTREGKLQVELAQLKYLLPRLVAKNTAMSRLTGGIGGRGPGETKLEINRRRVRERIARLEQSLDSVRRHRGQQKARRERKGLPIISIIGYTNAGKSTLLNTLTQSNVVAESRLFATLDPSSRRLRFPKEIEVIITDTVGFIRDLPKDLMVAFRATLEELENADLLLHVIDISNPRYEAQIQSVERILADLKLEKTRVVRVLNKADRVDPQTGMRLSRQLKGISLSARSKATLMPLIEEMEKIIGMMK
ncbi:MAG: GTPase HflX [Desulfobacterales bacterium]|nr:GTPase HflX [Desulfobacterales bacterium]